MRRIALVLGSALLISACPAPPSKTDTTEPESDVVDVSSDVVVTDLNIPEVECETVADCESVLEGPFPECKALGCEEGKCVIVGADEGSPCSDDGVCTLAASCMGGSCVATESNTCDDENPCTTDGCDPGSGCVNTFNQKPCDDGTVCTIGDHCIQGECLGDELDCDDGNECTDDVCDVATACSSTIRTGACSDGDACTDSDQCQDGQCVAGPELDCDDDEACTIDSCDSLAGCQATIIDGDCDDGNACTIDDSCKAGSCLGNIVKCDDAELCTSDYCDPVEGCVYQPNALPCDDGESCTLDDQCCFAGLGDCTLGTCVAGTVDPLCCDEDEGCDDLDLCTNDACNAGYCAFTAVDCSDGHGCTSDVCVDGDCVNDPYGKLESGEVFADSFEIDTQGWTLTSSNADVEWQIDSFKKNTGQNALYCGNKKDNAYSYDFGATLASATRSFDLPPSNKITLSLYVLQDLQETGSCTYDVTTVHVNGEEVIELCSNLPAFAEQTYDLSAYAGETISVEIRFDTKDGIANAGLGVWVDDVTINAESPEGCCDDNDQCAGGDGCAAEICLEGPWECGVPEGAVACDDSDACTLDSCSELSVCANEAIADCCTTPADCAPAPEGECAVIDCLENACSYDLSGCGE